MKQWAHNEIVDETDLNWLSSRAVNRYATTTEREAGIPAPVEGMVAHVATDGLTVYTGTEWAALIPVPAGGTTGQVLAKTSNDDYDFGWTTP